MEWGPQHRAAQNGKSKDSAAPRRVCVCFCVAAQLVHRRGRYNFHRQIAINKSVASTSKEGTCHLHGHFERARTVIR